VGFNAFYAAYPRKVGKQEALKAWKKLKADEELQHMILVAIAAQLEGHDWKREEGAYIPHPATWLNGGRWMDEVRAYTPPEQRRATDQWWLTMETMESKGKTLTPPVLALPGENIVVFKRRLEAAIEQQGKEVPAPLPTPYTPPMPAAGEQVLTQAQRKARMAELREATGMKPRDQQEDDHDE
jgi:hypothetical protein